MPDAKVIAVKDQAKENEAFRSVLFTGEKSQLVIMSLLPGEDIGEEVHTDVDQFFRVEKGKGVVTIDGKKTKIESDTGIIVPAGARHNVKNTGDKMLRLYTIYSPPEHADMTVRATKAEARKSAEHFDGTTTE
jgi:mannose-6-phosphate isomerase-like protein (cupin superfamily)